MQAIAEQLAARIPSDALSLNCRVQSLDLHDDGVTARGDGFEVRARKAILAVSHNAVPELLPDIAPRRSRAVTTYYHRSSTPGAELLDGRAWVLTDMLRRTPIANSVVLTNAAPSYAPAGETLVSTSVLGLHREIGAEAIRRHLSYLYGVDASTWEEVARYEMCSRNHGGMCGWPATTVTPPASTALCAAVARPRRVRTPGSKGVKPWRCAASSPAPADS